MVMGRRKHLGRSKRGTPLYSKEDIREQYCINEKQLNGLEDIQDSGGLFGCLSSYHVDLSVSLNFVLIINNTKLSLLFISPAYSTKLFIILKQYYLLHLLILGSGCEVNFESANKNNN